MKTKIEKKLTKKQLKKLEKREINRKDKEWRLKVKERDNSKCYYCGRTDIIQCHHIIPRQIKELRWIVDNGLCSCPKHHKFCRYMSCHNNSFMFVLWLLEFRTDQVNRLRKFLV